MFLFSGVGLESVLTELRSIEDDALQIQIQVFEGEQHKDEEDLEPLSHQHLFDILFKKV